MVAPRIRNERVGAALPKAGPPCLVPPYIHCRAAIHYATQVTTQFLKTQSCNNLNQFVLGVRSPENLPSETTTFQPFYIVL